MKILFLSDFAYNTDGKYSGTERFVFGLAESLNQNSSIQVDILAPNWEEKDKTKFKSKKIRGVNVHLFKTHSILKHNLFTAIKRIKDYSKYASNHLPEYDLYHGFSTLAPILAGISIAKKKKKKSVTTLFIRDNIEANLNFLIKPIVFHFLKKTDVVTTNFWENEKYYKEKYGFNNILTVPVWIEEHFKPTKNKKNKTKIILFIGRIIKEKGIYILLKSFAKLKEKMNNVKLVIAGITEKNQLPEKIKELGLEKGIIVKGFLSEKELVYWYNKASVLVAPTLLKEGWTWTSLEAMACGTPSIVTEEIKIFGVNKEFQKVVKKGDEEELASALYNLLTNEKEYKLIKNNGFNIINEYFNKGKIMNKYKKVYNDLCKKK